MEKEQVNGLGDVDGGALGGCRRVLSAALAFLAQRLIEDGANEHRRQILFLPAVSGATWQRLGRAMALRSP